MILNGVKKLYREKAFKIRENLIKRLIGYLNSQI
ncbi:hypothetical protein B0H69_005029 [Clostridium beijerinckii]|jgi:hypothetical protein|nr:hypothetical protein [Clostridium beijerinckii]NOV70848.1 hypothetical protein [Clostridium beijerinckii]NOW33766.1 hypothetical protein [Clostridium beijerinckii]NOW83435.1 hypothetical protein [Clostridium beijerinckii]NRT23684.1 hypothetical protein [Clostridium beijerinckii]